MTAQPPPPPLSCANRVRRAASAAGRPARAPRAAGGGLRAQVSAADGTVGRMDLTYPPEAEAFRSVIRQWLEENLPEGWGSPGFTMTKEERRAFNDDWVKRLFD